MMQTRIPPMFKISALAAALVTLTGCASTPSPNEIGDTIMSAGRITADASVRAYEGTKRVLGFDRAYREEQQAEAEARELDEVDIALQDTQGTWAAEQPVARASVPVRTADLAPAGMPAIASMPAIDPNAIPVATVDYNHIVGPQETMWTIAKSTTGNANNWRILAEINQLDLNSPMRIGQEILVPADLVLPEIVASISPNQRLAIPTETTVNAQSVVTELQPLDLQNTATAGVDVNTTQPVTRESLTSDPLSNDSIDEVLDDGLIIVEASASADTPVATADPSLGAVAMKADAGETLWDLSKRTTGDATNWKVIAEQNNFSETDIGRIRYGQTIYVPTALAKAEFGGDKIEETVDVSAIDIAPADVAATENLVAMLNEKTETNESVEASAALVASASNLMDETQELKIVEATYQTDQNVPVDSTATSQDGQSVMVSGTYYPKAIYNEADFSSSLLMRVSPGTEITVSRAMGPWYEVQTEFGVGYMHSRDVRQ